MNVSQNCETGKFKLQTMLALLAIWCQVCAKVKLNYYKKTSPVHFHKIISSVNYSVTQKNQTKPPFFHACHSYTLIKFEYFSRQKVIRGVNKFVVYDLVQSCSRNKPHILGTKMLLQKCTTTQLLLHYKTLRLLVIFEGWKITSLSSPDSQIQRRSLLKKPLLVLNLLSISCLLMWFIFVSFVSLQLDVAYVWR